MHKTTVRLPSYLHLNRFGRYGFRIVIPKDLRVLFNSKEYRLSLRTSEKQHAKRIALHLSAFTWGYFERIRVMKDKSEYQQALETLKEEEAFFDALGEEQKRFAIDLLDVLGRYEEIDSEKSKLINQALALISVPMEDHEVDSKFLDLFAAMSPVKQLESDLNEETSKLLMGMQEHELSLEHLNKLGDVQKEHEGEKSKLMDWTSDLLERAHRKGQEGASQSKPMSTHSEPLKSAVVTISELLVAFLGCKASSKKPIGSESEDEYRASVDLFVKIFGDMRLDRVDRGVGMAFREKLIKLPANMNKIAAYRGKSIDEVIAMNPENTLAPRTINKRLEKISTMFKWAIKEGDYSVSKNPFEGAGVVDQAVKNREAYSDSELIQLFSSKEFVARRFDCPYQFWLIPMALFSGARQTELAQLHVADIVNQKGTHCFSINDNGESKRIKNQNSKRMVPIHKTLIDMGLLQYVEELRSAGETKLFPEIVPHPVKGPRYVVSKWFGQYRKRCGITSSSLDFHSLRKTFITRLLDKGSQQHQVAQVVGHEKGLITGDVYWTPDVGMLGTVVDAFDVSSEVRCLLPKYMSVMFNREL